MGAGEAAAVTPLEILLDAKDVHKSFGAVQALDGVSLQVHSGEIVGLIGPNGSGKTTLFNCVSGFESINSGNVIWRGSNIEGWTPQRRARHGLVRTFQHVSVFPELSPRSSLLRAIDCRHAIGAKCGATRASIDEVEELLELCGLRSVEHERVGNLAYGIQRLVNVAMTLVTRPTLLMLDEPAAGLSKSESQGLSLLLRTIRDVGVSVCIVDHNMPFLSSLCDRIIVIDSGRNLFEGSPLEVSQNDEVRRVYLGSGK
jgi:ABC-type branched-subunit amino acid transport system ATPase component